MKRKIEEKKRDKSKGKKKGYRQACFEYSPNSKNVLIRYFFSPTKVIYVVWTISWLPLGIRLASRQEIAFDSISQVHRFPTYSTVFEIWICIFLWVKWESKALGFNFRQWFFLSFKVGKGWRKRSISFPKRGSEPPPFYQNNFLSSLI